VFVAVVWRAGLAATHAKHDAEALLRDSYFEQGRLRVLDGDKLGALAPLAAAYRMGSTGVATRLMLEEAAQPTRARLLTLEGHTDQLWDVAYSPDGKWLATAGDDRTARIWDAATGAPRATVRHAGGVAAVAFSPDSRLMATCGNERVVRVWDVIAGREVAALPTRGPTFRIEFSADGTLLLATAYQRVVELWRMPSGTPAGALEGHGAIHGATFCQDGTCIVTWDAARVVVWDAATLEKRMSYSLGGLIRTAAISRSGALLAVGTESGELALLRRDGTLIAKRAAHEELIYDVAFSPDETVLATGGHDRMARLWSTTGELRGVLAGHRANITRVRFTPTGDRLVTTSADGTARLWSASGMLLGELAGHANFIMAAAIRSDGARLATASWDRTVMVWDLARAQELRPLVAVRDGVIPMVAFDPSGDRLAIARADGSLSVFDARTGAVVCTAAGATAIEKLAWTAGDEIAEVRGEQRGLARAHDLAADLDDDRLRRLGHGQFPTSSRLARSSQPSTRFMFWIAWPAPPLIRLSSAAKQVTVRLPPLAGPTAKPTSAWFEPATATTSGSRLLPGRRTNGSRAKRSSNSAASLPASISADSSRKQVAKMPRVSGADTGTNRSSTPLAPASASVCTISGTCW